MVKATRGRTGMLGLDLREQAFISFGGSGALFTPDIALAVGAKRVLVPELASVLSAFGAATTDIRRERIHSMVALFPVDPAVVARISVELSRSVLDDLAADGVSEADRSVYFEADLRFSKQISEIAMPLPAGGFDAGSVDALLGAFRSEYARRYGHGALALGAPIELATIRAVGIGRTTQAVLSPTNEDVVTVGTPAPIARRRSVRLERGDAGREDIAVFDGDRLRPGHALRGPALIDARDTTIWVPAGATAAVNRQGTLLMEMQT
jgi:N-methylhydantoinase A